MEPQSKSINTPPREVTISFVIRQQPSQLTQTQLHSTQRKRSRFIIALNTQYVLSFVIAHSNSKNTGQSCEFASHTSRPDNSLFTTIYFSVQSLIFYSARSIHCHSRPRPSVVGRKKNLIDCRPRSNTCCDDAILVFHQHTDIPNMVLFPSKLLLLCCVFLGSLLCVGVLVSTPQPLHRSWHGCTVGFDRDPPV